MDLWITCLVFILCTHYICDFVLQGEDIVNGVADIDYILSHCTKYAFVFAASAWIVWLLIMNTSFEDWVIFSAINAITHAGIDYLLIPIATRYFSMRRVRLGSLSLVFDQLLHSITIVLSFIWITI